MLNKKLILISGFFALIIFLVFILFYTFYNLLALKKTGQEYLISLLSQEIDSGEKAVRFEKNLNKFNSLLTNFNSATKLPKLVELENLSKLVLEHLDGQHKYMLIFQNSQELRATGGFMGSFALLELKDGQIQNLNFYDIYDADGQFEDFVAAPAGIEEYLSSGQGQRLPDANWHPDFPKSSQKILTFMAESGFKNIDGIVAINLKIVTDLLTITGDIYLPDYGVTVTSENFANIARADRETYFPGSKNKKQFLEVFFNHLKIKLSQLNKEQQEKIFLTIKNWLLAKDLQFYANNPDIQKNLEKLNITGELKPADNFIYLVESNVGINKANKNIAREINLNISNNNFSLEIFFTNNNQELDYVNYQRLILDPEAEILDIKIDQQILELFDEEIITNSKGEKFKQIGFLAPVPAKKSTSIQIEFVKNNNKIKVLNIIKQPGLPPTPYTVISDQKNINFILEKDELIYY